MHLDYATLEQGLHALPSPPTDAGTVVEVVTRPTSDERETLAVGKLTPERGLEGDRWGKRAHVSNRDQITVMRADFGRMVANGQPLALFGDNLVVELDLSEENLPAGTRLRIGQALCEVTPQPHTGCAKYQARFGKDARDLTLAKEYVPLRLRGLYVCVLEAGEVRPGDPIQVLSRPAKQAEPLRKAA
jgi:MOSC domain-containing protein YiiM